MKFRKSENAVERGRMAGSSEEEKKDPVFVLFLFFLERCWLNDTIGAKSVKALLKLPMGTRARLACDET